AELPRFYRRMSASRSTRRLSDARPPHCWARSSVLSIRSMGPAAVEVGFAAAGVAALRPRLLLPFAGDFPDACADAGLASPSFFMACRCCATSLAVTLIL